MLKFGMTHVSTCRYFNNANIGDNVLGLRLGDRPRAVLREVFPPTRRVLAVSVLDFCANKIGNGRTVCANNLPNYYTHFVCRISKEKVLVEVKKESVRHSTCRVNIGFHSGTLFLTLMDIL